MQIVEFIQGFIEKTKSMVEYYEKNYQRLSGTAKKARLDESIHDWVESNFDSLVKMNFIIKPFVKKYVLKNISKVTQALYNLIRSKIVGVGN